MKTTKRREFLSRAAMVYAAFDRDGFESNMSIAERVTIKEFEDCFLYGMPLMVRKIADINKSAFDILHYTNLYYLRAVAPALAIPYEAKLSERYRLHLAVLPIYLSLNLLAALYDTLAATEAAEVKPVTMGDYQGRFAKYFDMLYRDISGSLSGIGATAPAQLSITDANCPDVLDSIAERCSHLFDDAETLQAELQQLHDDTIRYQIPTHYNFNYMIARSQARTGSCATSKTVCTMNVFANLVQVLKTTTNDTR